MEFKSIDNLLRTVSLELEVQRRLPRRFNVFDIADVRHYETRHSAILAGILQWSGSKKPLAFFLKKLFNNLVLSEKQLADLSISTEYCIDVNGESRRLDILIYSKDVCVVIENKIFTEDHTNQLNAYKQWMDQQRSQYRSLVYLTLEGTASSENFPDDQYVRMSWKTDIRDFLLYCSSLANIDTRFNSTTLQYAEFWENWFMETDELKENVSASILSSKENFLAAQEIFHAFTETKYKLIKGTLEKWQKGKNTYISWDKVENMYGSSCEKISFKWNDKYYIGFEFAKNFSDLCYGIFASEETKDRQDFPGWSNSSWWPAYKYIRNDRIRYLGENSEICLSDAEKIYDVLDSAFTETIAFVKEHIDFFGEQTDH